MPTRSSAGERASIQRQRRRQEGWVTVLLYPDQGESGIPFLLSTPASLSRVPHLRDTWSPRCCDCQLGWVRGQSCKRRGPATHGHACLRWSCLIMPPVCERAPLGSSSALRSKINTQLNTTCVQPHDLVCTLSSCKWSQQKAGHWEACFLPSASCRRLIYPTVAWWGI